MRDNAGPSIFDGTDPAQILKPRMLPFFNNTGATITAGTCVQIDVTTNKNAAGAPVGTCIKPSAATAADARKIIGAAAEDIPDQRFGLVQTAGYQANVNVLTGVAADSPLIGSAANAGRLIAATFAAGEYPVALCIALAASNLAPVLWKLGGL